MIKVLRWIAVRLGQLALLAIGVYVAYVVIAGWAGAPANHDVFQYGGRTIDVQVVSNPAHRQDSYLYGPLFPTTSLALIRCEAWQQHNAGSCPDDAALSADFWPELEQAPQMLYVGLDSTCDNSYWVEHLNVDYVDGSLALHCHTSKPLVDFTRPVMGVSAQIVTDLVLVPTEQMTPGPVYVYREDRIERWWSDEITTTVLGITTIP